MMGYYGFQVMMENLDGDYTERGIVCAKEYTDAENKVKRFYRREKVKKTEIWFETIDDVLILEGE